MDHRLRGKLVIARIIDFIDDSTYKIRATIQTGDISNRECVIVHKGNPDFLNGDVIIRLDLPFRKTNLNLADLITGHFISSSIPRWFEYADSEEMILYGIWEDRMKKGFDIPIIGKISEFYDPGKIFNILHYKYDYKIISYLLRTKKAPEIMSSDRKIRSAGYSLRKYLSKMKKYAAYGGPRVVTIEEKINLDDIIPEFNKTELRHLKMDPQQ